MDSPLNAPLSASPSASLNAARRARELAELRTFSLDLLVVGLGATGAGVALDAASRGLSVAAVDAHDLAFGTSRWSSKLIHGGLRYLASGQVGVARESAVERGILMTTTAPHLVRAERFVLPLYDGERGRTVMLGYRLGDLLRLSARTPREVLPGPSRLSASEARALVPSLREQGLRGGLSSWDGRVVDDARLVLAVARTAAAHGARIITRCRALELSGKGARVRDELSGAEFTIDARAVVNATGVWAAELAPSIRLRPSRGTHLVLSPGTLGDLRAGMHVPLGGNRFALVLPQADGRVYVGLTDEPLDGPVPDVPQAPESDIAFLLEVLNSVLGEPVPRERVAGAYAGLRPLLDGEGQTADLSRRHAVITDDNNVITIVGGKLTTYRRMAEDAVDAACPDAPRSRTARLPLVGATTGAVSAPWRLVERYGAEATAVQDLAREDPALAEPVALGVTGAELLWAIRHEGALDAADVLERRTRIGLVEADGAAALPVVTDLLTRIGVSDA